MSNPTPIIDDIKGIVRNSLGDARLTPEQVKTVEATGLSERITDYIAERDRQLLDSGVWKRADDHLKVEVRLNPELSADQIERISFELRDSPLSARKSTVHGDRSADIQCLSKHYRDLLAQWKQECERESQSQG